MNTKTTTSSSSPASPNAGSDKPSPSEQNSLETQFSFFKIEEGDPTMIKSNKEQITRLMKRLENKGKLAPASFSDFKIIRSISTGNQGVVYKVVEKKEYHSHLNPDGSYYGGKYLALKVENFMLTNRLPIKLRELELMTDKFHKSAIQAEKVFFERDSVRDTYFVNIVTPWFPNTLMSWLLKMNNNEGNISDIKSNKRRFEEVRRMAIYILEGISMVHFRRNAHMDIKFDNILVDEFMNDYMEDENGEIKPILISQPIIADFGMVKDLTKETPSSSSSSTSTFTGYTPEFAGPEVYPSLNPLVSPKADIYSFGVILYKIFIDENDGSFRIRHSNPNLEINSENIKKRIDILFPEDKDTVSNSMIEDIAKIIISCLEDHKSRPQAANLLHDDHKFFKSSKKELSKVSDFEIENTFEYGLKLLEGKNGYPKDLKKSREIFEKLSNSFNHMPSKYFFGLMVYFGLGGNEDEKLGEEMMQQSAPTAMNYFESHCDDSLGFSEFAIGYIHCCGHGVPEDNSKALSSFQKSSNKGNSFAQSRIGLIYENGRGVEKNPSLAFDFYKKSALQGNCIAQKNLGFLYQNGIGIQQDYNEALKWYQLSANQEYPLAQNNIGFLYDHGHGVAVGKAKAVEHFKLAAEKGNAVAQKNLANKLEFGDGIAKDLDAAITWYKKAADQGDENAIEALERLKK